MEDASRPGKTRLKSSWLPRTIGSIAGVSVVDREPLFAVPNELLSVRKAFDSLDANHDLGGLKLAKQLKVLDTVPNLETQVAAFESAWAAFSRRENLQNVWLLSR